MKTFDFEFCGELHRLCFRLDDYINGGGQAVEMLCQVRGAGGLVGLESFASLSVNLAESPGLPDGVFYAKNYTEMEGVPERLAAAGLIELAGLPPSPSLGSDAYRLTEKGREYIWTPEPEPALVPIEQPDEFKPLPVPAEILGEILARERARLSLTDSIEDLLSFAAYFPQYSTGQPGYVGPVVVIVWQICPGAVSTFIRGDRGRWEHCNSSAY